jgi:pimeloyl-ACP methyl ester carboxylesterase
MLPDRVVHQSASREDRLAGLDMQFRTHALAGVKQLAFNNEMDALKLAITESAISQTTEHWTGSPERSREAFRAVILWPLERRAMTQTELAKIKCPVNIIYCTEDVVYSVENAHILEVQLKDVGLSAKLYQVPGSHYGCVAGAKEINPIIRELVFSCYDVDELPSIPLTAEGDGIRMKTPFDKRLEKYDYQPSDYSEIQLSGLQYARF